MDRMGSSRKISIILLATFSICVGLVASSPRERRQTASSPFTDLSVEEMTSVHEYLHKQNDLNLAGQEHAKVSDAFIYMIEPIRPKKADALKYLDASGPLPHREARVVIFRGDLPTPVVQEYRVFPIPNPSYHKLLKNPTWRDPIPFSSRPPYSHPKVREMGVYLDREMAKINGILAEASGHTYYSNCTERCLTMLPGLPPYAEMNHHQLIIYPVKQVEGSFLHPIGLQFVINMDSPDVNLWTIDYVWFQGQVFADFDRLLEAKNTNRLEIIKVPDPEGMGGDILSSSLNFRGTPRPEELLRGPRMQMPDGNRFKVNGRKVTWLGWEFEFSMLSSTGIELYNVKFLKERIAYELSLQEIGVFYSGGSPVPRHTIYFDSLTNIGIQTSQVFNGIDCPKHAKFFDFVHYLNGKPHVFKNGACVFEHDLGVPLRRHYGNDHMGGYTHAQGMPGNVLIFRHVLTVYNYDYVIDFVFYQGGQIEGKVTLSGYLLNTFYTGPEMDKFGHVVNVPTSLANIHHHVINMKADLDIGRQKNTFETLDISLQEEDDPLNPGFKIYNRIFTKNVRKTEKAAAYKYNFDKPKYLVVSNSDKNKFGNPRGYRILSESMSKMMLPETYRGQGARSWTNYQAAVTKYKETERQSSTMYSSMEPYDPIMSFQDFIDDDENIEDEDLVVWLTLGTHHIPHSEDVPIVLSPGVQLKFYLLPYNFFDEDPSLASRDNIRVTPDGKGGNKYQYSGWDEEDFEDTGKDTDDDTSTGHRLATTMSGALYVIYILVLGVLGINNNILNRLA